MKVVGGGCLAPPLVVKGLLGPSAGSLVVPRGESSTVSAAGEGGKIEEVAIISKKFSLL